MKRWRVYWWNFTGNHSWLGHRAAKKQPKRHSCDFATREAADDFAKDLRLDEEIVTQVVSLLLPLPGAPPPCADTGYWPRQLRQLTE